MKDNVRNVQSKLIETCVPFSMVLTITVENAVTDIQRVFCIYCAFFFYILS